MLHGPTPLPRSGDGTLAELCHKWGWVSHSPSLESLCKNNSTGCLCCVAGIKLRADTVFFEYKKQSKILMVKVREVEPAHTEAHKGDETRMYHDSGEELFLDFLPPSSPFSLLFHEDWWISPFDNPDSFQYIPSFFPKSLWMGSYSFQSNDFCLMISDKDQNRLHVCACAQLLSGVQLFVAPETVAHQAPLSMEFSRQEYWCGLPLPAPGDLPDPGIELPSLASPPLAGRLFTTVPPGKFIYI